MKVTILSGLPGSGKSTWARRQGAIVVSADHFFTGTDGVYRFDPALIGAAHGACLRNFADLVVASGVDHVIVDNTNLSAVEIAPYYALAQAYGREVKVLRVRCDAWTAFERNTHGVSEDTFRKMIAADARLAETLPPWWTVEEVTP